MRKLCALAALLLAGCDAGPVPRAAMDQIELAYIQGKVFGDQAVECVSKTVEAAPYVACRPFGAKAVAHLWLYEGEQLQALNGPARAAYEARLSGKPGLGLLPLQVASSTNTGAVFEAFTR